MSEPAKEFSPTKAERRALLAIDAQIKQLAQEGGQIYDEARERLGLPAGTQIAFDEGKGKFVLMEPEKKETPKP